MADAHRDTSGRELDRRENEEGRERFDFITGTRARLEHAAERRRSLRTQSWSEFWRDLGLRVAAIAAIVIVVALVLWLIGVLGK